MQVAIVGCGSIGALKPDDLDGPGSEHTLTIAHACHKNEEISEIVFLDNDQLKSEQASAKWNGLAMHEMPHGTKFVPKIYFVCVPTKNHLGIIEYIFTHSRNPDVIVCEKPFCQTTEDAQRAIDYIKERSPDTKLIIDYQRNYMSEIKVISDQIKNGEFGEIYNASLTYGRGIQHDACHAVSLFIEWFGDVKSVTMPPGKAIPDLAGEQTIGAVGQFEKCDYVFFKPTDGRQYCIYEIEINAEKCRVRLTNYGQEIQVFYPEPEPHYGKYNRMASIPISTESTRLNWALESVVDSAVRLAKGEENVSPVVTPQQALQVHRFYDLLGNK